MKFKTNCNEQNCQWEINSNLNSKINKKGKTSFLSKNSSKLLQQLWNSKNESFQKASKFKN